MTNEPEDVQRLRPEMWWADREGREHHLTATTYSVEGKPAMISESLRDVSRPNMAPVDRKRREVQRENISAWFGFMVEYPDEGSVLMILGADASPRDAIAQACELLGVEIESNGGNGWTPAESVGVRRAWEYRDGVIRYNDQEGNSSGTRVPSPVEEDLLEKLTVTRWLARMASRIACGVTPDQ